jgi:dephospho-CoA kinase
MTYPNIALIGKARSGKDTVAAHLIATHRYTRVAFADPLKEMALALDPILEADTPHPQLGDMGPVRLAEMVRLHGWEIVKDQFSEARRVLQYLGSAVREQDEAFWVSQALRKIRTATTWNLPVVVTDCRYMNEALLLRAAGFTLIRIDRPGTDPGNHASETELDHFVADERITNASTLEELYAQVDKLVP